MKKIILVTLLIIIVMSLASCTGAGFVSVPMSDLEKHMTGEYIILDVRTQSEYDSGHIPGALLLPNEDITEETAQALLPDKDKKLLVYCRSGNRSKQASAKLYDLGYKEIIEVGGINSYTGEIEY